MDKDDDHYEILQVSRSADPLIITKAFRVLAAVFHPDNKESGDPEMFRRVALAHRVLSDPVRRAAYDRAHVAAPPSTDRDADRRPTLRAPAGELPLEERQLRRIILHVTYDLRRSRPTDPGITLPALAEVCGATIDQLQFSMWYLRGKKLIDSTAEGELAITVAGVDVVEGDVTGSALPLPEFIDR